MEHKNTQSYVVRPGDTMTSIAKKFNTTLDTLMKLNPQITDPNRIYPGQVIIVPAMQGGHGEYGCPGQMPWQISPSMTFPTQNYQTPYPCFPSGNPCSGWSMPCQMPYSSNNWWMNQQGMWNDNWYGSNPGYDNNANWGNWNNMGWNYSGQENDTASIQQAPNTKKKQK